MKINDIDVIVPGVRDNRSGRRTAGERTGMIVPSEPVPGETPSQNVPVLLSGGSHQWDSKRLASLTDHAPLVELSEDAGVAGLGGEPAIAELSGYRSLIQNPTLVEGRLGVMVLGSLSRFRGRLQVSVRTRENVWEEPGTTRIVLPENSVHPSDAYEVPADFLVATPDAHPLSDNWGDQDAAYTANEVARGLLFWDWRAESYKNQVKVEWDPSGTVRRAEIPGLGSSSEAVRAYHRTGHVELRPATGVVVLTDSSGTRTLDVADFTHWSLVTWDPFHALFYLGGGLHVEVNQNRLVRFIGAGSKLSFQESVTDVNAPAAFSASLGDSWRIASTEDYDVTTGAVTISDDGDCTIIRGDADQASILMKDVRARIGVSTG